MEHSEIWPAVLALLELHKQSVVSAIGSWKASEGTEAIALRAMQAQGLMEFLERFAMTPILVRETLNARADYLTAIQVQRDLENESPPTGRPIIT